MAKKLLLVNLSYDEEVYKFELSLDVEREDRKSKTCTVTFDRKCHEKNINNRKKKSVLFVYLTHFSCQLMDSTLVQYGGESDLTTGNYICDPLNNF